MGDMMLTIRQAGRADTRLVLEMIFALAEYEKMTDQVVATEELIGQWLFDRQVAEAVIAEQAGEPVGFALYFHNYSTFLGRGGIYLEDLFVYPQYRGKGYGKALLRHLAQTVLARQGGRLEWSCLDWNRPSIDFYKSLGAEPMEEWTVYRLSGDTLQALAEGQ